MRIAIIADIHGNLAALEAVLEATRRERVDAIAVAGDIVNGAPDSRACWDLVRSLGYPLVRGNHERYLFDLYTERAEPEWHSERFGPVQWSHRQFEAAHLDEMRRLPLCVRLPEAPDLLIVHGSSRADRDVVLHDTACDELDTMFSETAERLIARGHNHTAGLRRWRGRTVVTTGSAGLPLDGSTTAKYLLVEHDGREWRYLHRETDYDSRATLRRFRDSGYLDGAGPMARLAMQEVISARHHMGPFLRQYDRWSLDGRLSLADAVDRFLQGAPALR
jgi:predicted phosphodiesterase